MEDRLSAVCVVAVLVSLTLAGCTQAPGGDGDELRDEIARLRDRLDELRQRPTSGIVDSGIVFEEIADDPAFGLDYAHAPTTNLDQARQIQRQGTEGPVTGNRMLSHPEKPWGAPGVAILDFDEDDDRDLLVTNGPGSPNHLFESRLAQTGELTFEEVAVEVGVAAPGQGATGTCYGDTDNDGDEDLLVLSRTGPHRLFENQLAETGEATFEDATPTAGLGRGRGSVACSMGDVDGDGRLDIFIGNTWEDWSTMAPIFFVPWERNDPNQLFRNRGDNRFVDVTNATGAADLARTPDGAATITWAVAIVDVDGDGDQDLVQADDQGGVPDVAHDPRGGADRGYNRLLVNDGTGNFTDLTYQRGLDRIGDWMGLAFADLNHDGHLDFFSTNFGDYAHPPQALYHRGADSSDWFLQRRDGSFRRPGVGALVASPFGWGVAPLDHDADGDTDLIFHGALDVGQFAIHDNPGSLLVNDGQAGFRYAPEALSSTNHSRRDVEGVAVGDLDADGFPDIVSVSGYDVPPEMPVQRFDRRYGSPFDRTARYAAAFEPTEEGTVWGGPWRFGGVSYTNGSLSVEVNQGNDHGSIVVETRGSVGQVPGGRVNRDGIGARVKVTPAGGETAMRPVVGGSSYASQNSLAMVFGLGDAPNATVEVVWPGGASNVLDRVRSGERVLVPEIPCDADGTEPMSAYRTCVADAVDALVDADVLDPEEGDRFEASMLRARSG